MNKAEKFKIETDDYFSISATLFTKEARSPHLIIIGPATGAPQYYYKSFAEYASGYADFDVVTFDYRGIGESLYGSVIDCPAKMSDWGEKDLKAVIKWADDKYEKIFMIGHSVAGQIFPKATNNKRITAAYFVGAQSAYYGHWKGLWKVYISCFWHVIIPVVTFTFDYLPGWTMGGNIPIPKKVALEWRKWGLHKKGVIQSHPDMIRKFEAVRIPMHFVTINDDKLLAPAAATQKLMNAYTNAVTSYQFIKPKDLGLKRIGHFGFFKKSFKKQLWPMPMFFFTQFIRKLDD